LTTTWHLLEGLLIERGQQGTDAVIQLRQREESLVADFSHDPAFDQ
jgi:hypothetical protein